MKSRRPWIIAHRGASLLAPESTEAAIRRAVAAKADMVELDVQMSREGRLVIVHDDRLERTTDGAGRVSAASYRTLSRLDAGSWFHPRFAGQRILLASQAARLILPPVWMNLELKRTSQPLMLIRHVRRFIARARITRRLLLSSFDLSLLRPWRASGVALAVICARAPRPSLRAAIRLGCRAWHPHLRVVTRTRIAEAHAAGLRVHVWTVDDRRTAQRLARWGADGFFTNNPAGLR